MIFSKCAKFSLKNHHNLKSYKNMLTSFGFSSFLHYNLQLSYIFHFPPSLSLSLFAWTPLLNLFFFPSCRSGYRARNLYHQDPHVYCKSFVREEEIEIVGGFFYPLLQIANIVSNQDCMNVIVDQKFQISRNLFL